MPNLIVFDKECHEAFDRAAEAGAINPLRFFLIKWATHVAIHRRPARSAALREAERIAGDPNATEEDFRAAMETSSRILAEAQQEIGRMEVSDTNPAQPAVSSRPLTRHAGAGC